MASKSSKVVNKGQYNNPNGHMNDEDFKIFKKKSYEELYKWLQKFEISKNPCPPIKKCHCQYFQCERCWSHAIGKEFYDYVYKDFDRVMDKSKREKEE